MRAIRSVTAAAVVAMLLTSCGGSSSSTSSPNPTSAAITPTMAELSAGDYAKQACTSMQTWVASIEERSQAFQPSGSNLESVKQAWLDFLDGVIADTDQMLSELEALGTPAVDGAEEAVSGLTDGLQRLNDAFTTLRDESAQLSTAVPAQFQKDFKALLTDFQNEMAGLGDAFNQISNPELDKAFNAEPACASLSA